MANRVYAFYVPSLLARSPVFSNILKIPLIQVCADSDEQEHVQQVQEFYSDFCAIDLYHFSLNMHNNHIYMLPMVVVPPGSQSDASASRCTAKEQVKTMNSWEVSKKLGELSFHLGSNF